MAAYSSINSVRGEETDHLGNASKILAGLLGTTVFGSTTSRNELLTPLEGTIQAQRNFTELLILQASHMIG